MASRPPSTKFCIPWFKPLVTPLYIMLESQIFRQISAKLLPKTKSSVVVTQVPLHGIRLSQSELHQMNMPDVKVETQNASMRYDE